VKFCCIADEDTVRGFRLAGITGQAVTTAPQAAAAIQQAVERRDCGIIILTDTVAAGIRSQVDTIRLERDRPLIVEIPGPGGPLPGRKSLRQLVQEAVGMRLGPEEGG
jgi:V/A-type H+/Na+-transporting ATPase subunit F